MDASDKNTALQAHCREVVRLLGLTQGSVEIHCQQGEPKKVHVVHKEIEFRESKRR